MNNFKYEYLIWDWNGTLFDDAWLCVEVMNQLLRRRKLPLLTPERYQEIFGFPVIDYYRRAGFDFSVEPFFTISTEFIGEYERRRPECGLRPGSLALLQHNYQRRLPQAILSASKQALLEAALAQFGIRELFVTAVGLDNHHASGKLELGRQLVAEIGHRPGDILLIGDTVHDYEVAQAMGVDCWLIPSGHQDYRRLAASGARVIESLAELLV